MRVVCIDGINKSGKTTYLKQECEKVKGVYVSYVSTFKKQLYSFLRDDRGIDRKCGLSEELKAEFRDEVVSCTCAFTIELENFMADLKLYIKDKHSVKDYFIDRSALSNLVYPILNHLIDKKRLLYLWDAEHYINSVLNEVERTLKYTDICGEFANFINVSRQIDFAVYVTPLDNFYKHLDLSFAYRLEHRLWKIVAEKLPIKWTYSPDNNYDCYNFVKENAVKGGIYG